MKIDKISLIESKSEDISIHLTAEIKENGDLVLDGYDLGKRAEEWFGHDDYEYSLTLKAEFKDTVLLYLIKEKFANDSEFKKWLDEKQIPNEFWSY